MKAFLYDFWVIDLCSFIFWSNSDHKKYDFILVVYLFLDISSFKSEQNYNIRLSRTGFLYKQRR